MLQAHLEVKHAALVAPALDFFDAAPVNLGHTQLHKAKSVIGKPRITQSHPIAAPRLQIRKNLALDKFDQHRFRSRIGGSRRFGSGLGR